MLNKMGTLPDFSEIMPPPCFPLLGSAGLVGATSGEAITRSSPLGFTGSAGTTPICPPIGAARFISPSEFGKRDVKKDKSA